MVTGLYKAAVVCRLSIAKCGGASPFQVPAPYVNIKATNLTIPFVLASCGEALLILQASINFCILVFQHCSFSCYGATTRYYDFKVQYKSVTKLCKERSIVTVNGQFPGPTVYAHDGDRVIVKVTNEVSYNVTIHWHGVRQHFSCWSDGPSYITQCPIQPGRYFTYEFTLYQQKGTLWWHAHISWLRATVNGAMVIYPSQGVPYPFPCPQEEHVLILGEWWNTNVEDLEKQLMASGGPPPVSDAYLINGQPGPLYSCSSQDTFAIHVIPGKLYLLGLINAALNIEHFFAIANHNMTVVAVDGEYTKPFNTSTIAITPGQTTDVLITAQQSCGHFYMAMGPYMSANVPINSVSALALVSCNGSSSVPLSSIPSPPLPGRNDSASIMQFLGSLQSLSTLDNAQPVPQTVDRSLFFTIGLNEEACPQGKTCKAPNNTEFAASINNVTFQKPTLALLQAYYYGLNRSYTTDFPDNPPNPFDYTGTPLTNAQSSFGTKVAVLSFNSNVQIILQDTSLVSTENHPIHLHGYSFYVVGVGLGNYQASSTNFNLVDPPFRNTIGIPSGGWAAIRFTANNPGVWFMHCHLEIHTSWGLSTVFLVKNGNSNEQMLPSPPADLPAC